MRLFLNDLQWSVWGIDQKGFKIPPKYQYPLFIRKNPFAPPKLNKPKIIQPKGYKNKTSLLQLLISKAWAKASKQALFSWQAVEGAELYYLEISTQQDFRNPIVQEQVSESQFLWNSLDDSQTYYWRVAAGDQSGRMGVFTEPTLVELVLPTPEQKPKPEVVKAKSIKKMPQPKIIKPKIQKPKVKVIPVIEPLPVAKEVKKKRPKKPIFESLQVSYQPGYGLKNYTEDGSTKANLLGLNLQSLAFFLTLNWSYDTQLNIFVKYSQNQFEPTPKSNFPFQPTIDARQIQGQFFWRGNQARYGWGFLVADLPDTERVSFEEIKINQVITYGALVNAKFDIFSIHYLVSLGVVANNEQFGGYSNHRWTKTIFSESFVTGLELEAFYLTKSGNNTLIADGYLIFAYQF